MVVSLSDPKYLYISHNELIHLCVRPQCHLSQIMQKHFVAEVRSTNIVAVFRPFFHPSYGESEYTNVNCIELEGTLWSRERVKRWGEESWSEQSTTFCHLYTTSPVYPVSTIGFA